MGYTGMTGSGCEGFIPTFSFTMTTCVNFSWLFFIFFYIDIDRYNLFIAQGNVGLLSSFQTRGLIWLIYF